MSQKEKSSAADGPKDHGIVSANWGWRLAGVIAVIAAVNSLTVGVYLQVSQHSVSDLVQAIRDKSPERVLQVLGVDVHPVDMTGRGSGLIEATRVVSCLLTVGLTVHLYLTENYPLVKSNYGHVLHVKRWKRFTTFTCWCWLLLTVYFCSVAWNTSAGSGESVWLPVLFEVCFSTSTLVTVVVHFVLIPTAKRKDPYRYERLLNWRALVLHYANLTMMVVEAGLSGLPMHHSHWIFPMIYCNAYLLFALVWFRFTGVFYYFFLDFTKFWWSPFAYLLLFFAFGAIWVTCVSLVSVLDAFLPYTAQ